MGLLIQKGVRRKQPQSSVGPAAGPRGEGIALLVPLGPNDDTLDLVRGKRGTRTGLTTRLNTGFGSYPQFDGSNYLDLTLPPGIDGNTPITIAFTYRQTAQSNAYPFLLSFKPTGGTNSFAILASPTSGYYFVMGPRDGGSSASEFGTAPAPMNVDRAVVVTLSAGTESTTRSTRRCWINGVEQADVFASSFILVTASGFRLGGNYSASNPFEGVIGNFHIVKGLWSPTRAMVWSSNPFVTRQPRKRRLWGVSSATSTSLTVQEILQTHIADALILSAGSYLTMQDATHAHLTDAVTLTVQSQLSVAETTHTHSADAIILSTDVMLALAEAAHVHAADNLVLTSQHALTVAEATHAHSVDSLVLTTATSLSVQQTDHSHTVDGLALSVSVLLAPADTLHAHTVDNAVLLAGTTLAVSEALHAHSADNLTLTTALTLALADALHVQTADALVLATALSLAVEDALHAHSADATVLSTATSIVVNRTSHAHTADTAVLTLESWLAIADALQAHYADGVVLLLPDMLRVDRCIGVSLAGAYIQISVVERIVRATLSGQIISVNVKDCE